MKLPCTEIVKSRVNSSLYCKVMKYAQRNEMNTSEVLRLALTKFFKDIDTKNYKKEKYRAEHPTFNKIVKGEQPAGGVTK